MPRVAIVGGCRTPFVRAGGVFSKYSFLDLGVHVTQALVRRLKLDPSSIEEFIFSTVLLDPRAPNFAREIILRSGLPLSIPAHAVSNNCISGLVSLNMLAEAIRAGRIKVGVGGGAESMSRPTLTLKPKAEAFFLALSRARSLGERLKILASYRLGFVLPVAPSPKEPSTGLSMGQHCELTAQEFGIERELQDRIALRSHKNAARAQESGILTEEIEPFAGVAKDNLIRSDSSIERLAALKPVFDRSPKGTLTAGNSSSLTDGASLVCLMAEDEARKQRREILGFLEACEYSAIAPADGLLMAPALALPKLLQRQGLSLASIDLFEIHEAFAAQVETNLRAWEKGWSKCPQITPIGRVPEEKINVNGGSIAIGHPFAATGGRLLLSAVQQLKRSGKKTAVISVCAAGAMACAMLVRRD